MMFEAIDLMIPQNLENLHLPAPELLTFYKDIERRTLWVDSEIDSGLMEAVKWILRWNQEDAGKPREERKPITMLINSPGGDLFSTYTCVDVMIASETPIVTVNMGMAMSGAFMLLIAGERRIALRSSTAMYHSGSAGFEGTASQVETATKHYKKQLNQMKEYILNRTVMDVKTYNKYKDADGWVDSQEQLRLGIVHEIAERLSGILGV